MLYLIPKSPFGPPGLWLADRMMPPTASFLRIRWLAAGVDRRHELRLYAHASPLTIPPGLAADIRVLPGGGGTRWEQWDFMRALGRERPDVVFAPGYTAPLAAPAPTATAGGWPSMPATTCA